MTLIESKPPGDGEGITRNHPASPVHKSKSSIDLIKKPPLDKKPLNPFKEEIPPVISSKKLTSKKVETISYSVTSQSLRGDSSVSKPTLPEVSLKDEMMQPQIIS